jgi:hypothetical protein
MGVYSCRSSSDQLKTRYRLVLRLSESSLGRLLFVCMLLEGSV